MNKQAKKKSVRPGRPRKFESRRSFLVSLNETDVEWLDSTAQAAGISRAELVMALMGMIRYLQDKEYLRVEQHGLVWFRNILDPAFLKQQVLDGWFDQPDECDGWHVGIAACGPAIAEMEARAEAAKARLAAEKSEQKE